MGGQPTIKLNNGETTMVTFELVCLHKTTTHDRDTHLRC